MGYLPKLHQQGPHRLRGPFTPLRRPAELHSAARRPRLPQLNAAHLRLRAAVGGGRPDDLRVRDRIPDGRAPRWRLGFTPLFAAVFLLPLAVPEAVAALLWASTANGTQEGLLNRGLGLVGIGPVEWLQAHAFETVTVVNIWRGIPFAMVLFAAAIESIPRTTLEAGLIDGASAWQQFRRVVVPILRPQILTFLMLTTITTFGIFGLVFFLTRGGPGNVIGIYIFQQAFQFFQIGLGSAAGVLLLVVLLVLGAYYVWLMREQV